MKRQKYRGYIIDTDDLGRPYIYNPASPYSEESDLLLVYIDPKKQVTQIRAIIDDRVEHGSDCRHAMLDPNTGAVVLM